RPPLRCLVHLYPRLYAARFRLSGFRPCLRSPKIDQQLALCVQRVLWTVIPHDVVGAFDFVCERHLCRDHLLGHFGSDTSAFAQAL
ncbi:MAG TPA: hypothetical protein VIV62_01955, partial [Chthoniobacterales bacterium]